MEGPHSSESRDRRERITNNPLLFSRLFPYSSPYNEKISDSQRVTYLEPSRNRRLLNCRLDDFAPPHRTAVEALPNRKQRFGNIQNRMNSSLFNEVRQKFRLTSAERRVVVFVLAAFLLGLVTKCYRDGHPSPPVVQAGSR